MKAHWEKLSQRDKTNLSFSVLAVFILVVVYCLIGLTQKTVDLRQQIVTQQQLKTQLMASVDRLQAFKQSGYALTVDDMADLEAIVRQQLASLALTPFLSKLSQDEQGVALQFQQVPFDDLMRLLQTAWLQHGIDVEQLVISATDTTGLVTANCVLSVPEMTG